jgi:hypothetical protein
MELSGSSRIAQSEALMPKYFFDLKDGVRLVDPAGLDCADDGDAMAKGRAIALEVEHSEPADLDPNRHVAVIDHNGHQVGKIPIRIKPVV